VVLLITSGSAEHKGLRLGKHIRRNAINERRPLRVSADNVREKGKREAAAR